MGCSTCGGGGLKRFVVTLADGTKKEVGTEDQARNLVRINPGATYKRKERS